MNLTFITGNENKLREVEEIIGVKINSKKLNLPEIQAIEVEEIVKEKAKEAFKILGTPVLIEDTGLYFESLNGFPGALIKWLLQSIGNENIPKLLEKFENKNATAKTVFTLFDGRELKTFTGEIKGKIVPPRGSTNFGWDPIFEVGEMNKTFAELTSEEKNKISMRKLALEKLKSELSCIQSNFLQE